MFEDDSEFQDKLKEYRERNEKLQQATKEDFEISFKNAKAVSDYIGMIMRTGFAVLVAAFFKSEADSSTSWYWWGFMMYCAGLSLVLALVMTNSIINVTGLWLRA
jgi:hypothetical protein